MDEETNEIRTTEMNSDPRNGRLFGPVKKFFRYLTLQYCQNEVLLLCYILTLIAALIAIAVLIARRTVLITAQDVYNELCAAISAKDTITCVRILKKYPYFVNATYGRSKYTPFLRACLEGNTQVVKIMISAGADIHRKSLNGENAFYLATYYHVKHPNLLDASCIHTLYYAGVSINEPNANGLTPLQLAVYFGHNKLVKWLLKKGADVDVMPSPYSLARQQGHMETIHILRCAMGITNNAS